MNKHQKKHTNYQFTTTPIDTAKASTGPPYQPPVLLYTTSNWYKGGIKLFSPKTHFGIKVGIKVWANWYKGWYKQLLLLLTTLLTSFRTYINTIHPFHFLSGNDLVKGVGNA